jgi:superfamily I DNA/RNA helicase
MSSLRLAKKFVPSPQQATVFDWITNGTGSCVLEAVAGSGKTTTLVKALNLMSGSIFFGAYNKKIAVEIESRAPSKDGLVISTMHAAGFSAWRNATRHPQVNGDKVRDIFRDACVRNIQYATFERPVLQLVSLAKQAGLGLTGLPSFKSRAAWEQLVKHFDVETFDENTDTDNTEIIIKLAIKTLEASIAQNMKIVDFDDMIYAPLYHGARLPKYDWVLLDEAQDTNATRRALALGMLAEGGRLIAVGDRHQAIYGFTGADSDALDLIATETNAKQLPLTITYRCPKAVVAYAQQWVNHIQAAETAPEGVVSTLNSTELALSAKIGDAILCRFNAPLVEYVYKFIAAGTPAMIEGREIGKGLVTLARRWKVKSLAALTTKLEAWQERETAKATAKENVSKATAIEDQANCLKVIIARVEQKDPTTTNPVALVVAEIESIFADNQDSTKVVLLSSIHKSKGREWSKVYWLQTGPNKRARLDWQQAQERNLCYVAATRAMDELILVNIEKKIS